MGIARSWSAGLARQWRLLGRWRCCVPLVCRVAAVRGPRTRLGRISTDGNVTNYTGAGIYLPEGIAAGPDGALWFTNYGSNSIGRITTTGTVTSYTGPGISTPTAITAGPDGALWFTNYGSNSIGRITTTVTP